MRFLRKVLVFLFVRRKAQAHARAVLDTRAARRPTAEPNEPAAPAASAGTVTGAMEPVPDEAAETAASVREQLIREALAARQLHQAEWDALTPAQRARAVAGLGEGMAAIVKTFRAA